MRGGGVCGALSLRFGQDAFARDAELLADFLERALVAVLETEAKHEHLALARR